MNHKILGMIVAFASTAALAQTNTGSVTITGNITQAVAISDAVLTTTAGGAEVDNGGATAFNRNYNFNDINLLTPDANGFVRLLVSFRMRSNVGYRLAATATENISPNALAQSDIGFSVKSIAETGTPSQVFNSGARNDTAQAPFNSTASVNGIYNTVTETVTYSSTLADAAAGPNIITGERISVRGSLTSPNNYIQIQTELVFLPELLLPAGSFSHTVTYTAFAVP